MPIASTVFKAGRWRHGQLPCRFASLPSEVGRIGSGTVHDKEQRAKLPREPQNLSAMGVGKEYRRYRRYDTYSRPWPPVLTVALPYSEFTSSVLMID